MSRPDALYFRNTNHLDSMEFSPGRLIYNRIPKWITVLLVLQILLGTTIWCGLRAMPLKRWAGAVSGPEWLRTLPERLDPADINARFPWLTRLVSVDDAAVVLTFTGSQLAATLLVQLIALPLVRRRLRQHTGGLKDVFGAIRTMSTGVVPKPLTAGRPGEAGFLALAFNDMIARLVANRKDLTEANQTLERRVESRTQELREAAEKLEKMALIDSLTGLGNRRSLEHEGERKFTESQREGTELVCLIIDLDNFKGVNDALGHAKGDDLIRVAADTLRSCCRPSDFPARLGGDEFVVLLLLNNLEQVTSIADRLQREFREHAGKLLEGCTLKAMPSMSIGISSRKASAAASLTELMARADAALYHAKSTGKARSQIYRGAA